MTAAEKLAAAKANAAKVQAELEAAQVEAEKEESAKADAPVTNDNLLERVEALTLAAKLAIGEKAFLHICNTGEVPASE